MKGGMGSTLEGGRGRARGRQCVCVCGRGMWGPIESEMEWSQLLT